MTIAASAAQGILTIDLDAVVANWRHLATRVGHTECAAVVKADAYGLGAEYVAPALAAAGCRTFFVATLEEGEAVRTALEEAERFDDVSDNAIIYVLNGVARGRVRDFISDRLRPVLNSLADVETWASAGRRVNSPLPAALHVDTGMSRLGLGDNELSRVAANPDAFAGIDLTLLMSHLACADDPDHPLNGEQQRRFAAIAAALPPAPRSIANSSGIFLGKDFHHNLVRPGAALYGVAPNPSRPNPMKGVVSLNGRIVQVREIDTPRTVGYGATHQVTGPTRIATVSVGYADGFLRSLSNRGCGYIDGHAVPLVGRVSMDLTTFDVSDVPAKLLASRDSIELIGPHLPVDDVAAAAGTIGYEILTALGRRYLRVYAGGRSGHSC